MSYVARFRKPEGAEQYRAAYNATLAMWPVDHEAIDIKTSFGMTHINIAGSPDAPPLVLIPGGQISSTVWYPNIEVLSRYFRVYAVDVVDQTGLSVPTRKLKTPDDSANWLNEVLDVLGLECVPLVGHSNGSWAVLNMALRFPQRVERMVLLSPGPPLVRLRVWMLLRILPVFIMPTRRMFYWNFQWMMTTPINHKAPHPLVEQFMIGAMSYKPQELGLGVVTVFSDDELRQIKTPGILLIGEHERVIDPNKVLERSHRLMPHIETEVIRDAGHLMPVDQPDTTNARMLAFLTSELEQVTEDNHVVYSAI